MLPRLSIVIPVTHGIDLLEDTLVSVLENRPEACEVIVVHPCCYDDPYDLSGEVQFVESARRNGFVELANLGIAAARGDVVHLLACGTLVEPGWTEPAVVHFDEPNVSCVTPLVADRTDTTRIAAAGVRYGCGGRRLLIGRRRKCKDGYRPSNRLVGPTLAAAFYHRDTLARLGGLPAAAGDEFADLDIGLKLEERGYRVVFEPGCRIRAQQELLTPTTRSFRFAYHAERFFWRHAAAHGFFEWLVAHPLLVAAEALSDLVRFRRPRCLGRLAGCAAALWNRWLGASQSENAGTLALDDSDAFSDTLESPAEDDAARETIPLTPHLDARTGRSENSLRKAG